MATLKKRGSIFLITLPIILPLPAALHPQKGPVPELVLLDLHLKIIKSVSGFLKLYFHLIFVRFFAGVHDFNILSPHFFLLTVYHVWNKNTVNCCTYCAIFFSQITEYTKRQNSRLSGNSVSVIFFMKVPVYQYTADNKFLSV